MKSLKTRFRPHPRPPHSEIFNSRHVFFAGQTSFEAVPAGQQRIISYIFNILALVRM